MIKKFIKSNLLLFLVLALCIPVILPYFHSGYFPTHDGEWAVVRLSEMFRQVRDLQFPPRYSGALNFGYGYPLFNFTYPFPYYLGLLFYFPFHSFVVSIKIMFSLSVFLSAIFMYFASDSLWKNKVGAFLSATLYIYLPYRMVDLYVRGSIGESLSFVLFPLIFLLVLRLFDSPFNRFIVVSLALSISALVMTHNIMTVLFLPLILIFTLGRIFYEKNYKTLQTFLLSLALGLGISCFFWFPALFEKGNILLSIIPIADRNLYFVKPIQLLMPSWGYSPPTEPGGFSYQIGLAHIFVLIATLIVLAVSFIKTRFTFTPAKIYALLLIGISLVMIGLMFSVTNFVWQNIPLLKEINYPWTLLSQIGFIASLLAGFVTLQSKAYKYSLILIGFITVLYVFPYAQPREYVDRGDTFYLTNEATTTSSHELMPLWVKDIPDHRFTEKVEVIKGSAKISDLSYNSKSIKFKYESSSPTLIRVNQIYYPGWSAVSSNESVELNYSNPKGVIEFVVSENSKSIRLDFNETVPRLIADIVSIFSIIVVLFILLRPILSFKT